MSEWLLIENDRTATACAKCGTDPVILFLIPKDIYFVKCLNCSSKGPLRQNRGEGVMLWNCKQKVIRETPNGCRVYDGAGRVK